MQERGEIKEKGQREDKRERRGTIGKEKRKIF